MENVRMTAIQRRQVSAVRHCFDMQIEMLVNDIVQITRAVMCYPHPHKHRPPSVGSSVEV